MLEISFLDAGFDFGVYPETRGWHARSGTEWYGTLREAPEEFQGFLQTWLYFGVVSLFTR